MKCEICSKPIAADELYSDDSGEYHTACIDKWNQQSALDAGIPLSVIEGKTKLSDHFSETYIDSQCPPRERESK
jgi:hypothetical protein